MNIRRKVSLGLLLCAGIGASTGVMAGCPSPIALPTATNTNSITFGDGISYSLPILGLNVQSSPGQIDDCIVIATGSSGTGVTTNFAGMDGAYATPSGTGGSTFFRTGDAVASPDPGQLAAFVGDTSTTWDTRLSALSTFLAGNDMVVYFNHNQTNSGSAIDQDLFLWAQIALVDDAGVLPTLYFYFTSVPNNTGLQNFGQPGGNPLAYTGPQTAATSTYPSGADGTCSSTTPQSAGTFPAGGVGTGSGSGSACFMVRAVGQVCLNGPVGVGSVVPCSDPSAVTTVNENLGADQVANAVVFPEINAILAAAGFNGYDVLQADIRMGCNAATIAGGVCSPGSVLNNGFEQMFIGQLVGTTQVPEPGILALLGFALLGWSFARKRG
jgi:hypothetical protein